MSSLFSLALHALLQPSLRDDERPRLRPTSGPMATAGVMVQTAAVDGIPIWQLVLDAARSLHVRTGEFRLDEIVREVQQRDASRERGSIAPVVQGMTVNAGTGPLSPCGKPLRRVSHGVYVVIAQHDVEPSVEPARSPVTGPPRVYEPAVPTAASSQILIAGSVNLAEAMRGLGVLRPVFHSERDFQLALAWNVQQRDPRMRVRLETRPAPGVHLDLAFDRPDLGRSTAIELKYLTRAWTGEVGGERYGLKDHAAQDIRAYDTVKDICRVERFVRGVPGANGAVVALTNDSGYWRVGAGDRDTNAAAFRLSEGTVLSGRRAWGPRTGDGTLRGREARLDLIGTYTMRWADYSTLPSAGPASVLRQLTIAIE